MDTDRALLALQQCFPQLHVFSAIPIVQGNVNFVLEINHDLIFRFPRHEIMEADLLREIKFMPLLARMLSTPIPRFEYIWLSDQQYPHPIVGYQKLKGILLDDPRVLAEQRQKLLPTIARFLHELHGLPVVLDPHYGIRGGSVEWWVQLYRKRFEQIRAAVFPLLSERTQKQATQEWESYLSHHACLPFQPVFIHRDLWLHHVLCEPQQSVVTGVIDWGDAAFGDPVLDFVGFHMAWGRECVEELVHLARIENDPTFWQRLDFYLEFYFQFYPSYTEALKAAQRGDEPALTRYILDIERTFENGSK